MDNTIMTNDSKMTTDGKMAENNDLANGTNLANDTSLPDNARFAGSAKLDVRVYPFDEPKGNTQAFANVAINDMIAIRGIRVVKDNKGLFVSMPQSRDNKTGAWHDIAYARDSNLRRDITRAVLGEYHKQAELPYEQRGYEKPAQKSEHDMSAGENSIGAGENGINVDDIKLDAQVFPFADPQGNTKAFAMVTVDDLITIRGLRVVEGDEGMFVAMPQRQDKYLKYHDVAFPLTKELRESISVRVLDSFDAHEKSVDRKPSLTEKLANGANKAAEHMAPAKAVAKSRNAGVLD